MLQNKPCCAQIYYPRSIAQIKRIKRAFSSESRPDLNKESTRIISEHCISRSVRAFHLFAVDVTPSPRVFSPTVEDRGYVYAPNNAIAGNKPITIGHQYSIAAYLPEKSAEQYSFPWVVPLSCERVNTDQKGITVGMEQLKDCIQSQPSFKNELCVSMGDCAYSHPDCLGEAKKNPNQVPGNSNVILLPGYSGDWHTSETT